MAQLNVPAQPRVQTIQYRNLLGVDYQSDPTEVSRNRSPEMVNMISDDGGNPIKRYGYRAVGEAYTGVVSVGGKSWVVKIIDGKLHIVTVTISDSGEITEKTSTKISDHTNFGDVKHVFGFKNHIYILCSREWFDYDTYSGKVISVDCSSNASLGNMPDDSLIPTTMTLYKPNGNEMILLPADTDVTGMTQGVNVLTPWRRVEYCVTTETSAETRFVIPRQAKMLPALKVEVLDPVTFEWKETKDYTTEGEATIHALETSGVEAGNLAVISAVITLNQAPYTTITVDDVKYLVFTSDNSKHVPAGIPNVRITYAPVNMEKTDSVNEAVESDKYSLSTDSGIKIVLTNSPFSYIKFSVSYGGDTYDFAFEAKVADTQYKGENNILAASYDGDKTILIGTPSLWRVCSTQLPCSTTITAKAANITATVSNVAYDTLVSSIDAYLGMFRLDRKRLFESDTVTTYDSRLFGASRARTYYSRASAPFVIDDNFYFDVDQPVKMLAKSSSAITIIADEAGNSPIYLAKGTYDEQLGMPVYSITASNANAGAVSPKVMGVLNDEPLFLSETGIYGITTNYYSDKFSISRSGKINKRLMTEPNLSSAVGVVFNNYFYLAINNHMYILDGRHRDRSKNGDNSYECYFFDNMPIITDMYVIDNRLYFSDGTHLYTWNDELDSYARYLDNAVQTEDGVWHGTTVKCKWSSIIDDGGAPQYYKTLQKKGTMVTISPPMQTSCQITVKKDAWEEIYIGRFDGSTFALSDAVLDAFTKKKIKKYKRIQFIIENNEPEPFGIVSVVKSFILTNYAKR